MDLQTTTAIDTVCLTDTLAVASAHKRAGTYEGGMTVSYVDTLDDVVDTLVKSGFDAKKHDGFVSVAIGGPDSPFPAVLRISEETNQLLINCQLAKIGDFAEDQLAVLSLAALDMNTCIRPYAFAIISDTDDAELGDETQWPLVLTDSLTLGDLSSNELVDSMESLIQALIASRSVLEIGLNQ